MGGKVHTGFSAHPDSKRNIELIFEEAFDFVFIYFPCPLSPGSREVVRGRRLKPTAAQTAHNWGRKKKKSWQIASSSVRQTHRQTLMRQQGICWESWSYGLRLGSKAKQTAKVCMRNKSFVLFNMNCIHRVSCFKVTKIWSGYQQISSPESVQGETIQCIPTSHNAIYFKRTGEVMSDKAPQWTPPPPQFK